MYFSLSSGLAPFETDLKTATDILMYFKSKSNRSLDDEIITANINLLNSPLLDHMAKLYDSIHDILVAVNKSQNICAVDSTIEPPIPTDFYFDSDAKVHFGKSFDSIMNQSRILNNDLSGCETTVQPIPQRIHRLNPNKIGTTKDEEDEDLVKLFSKKLNIGANEIKMITIEDFENYLPEPFTIVTHPNHEHRFFVSQIKSGLESKSNRLQIGDEILQINDLECKKLTLPEIVNEIETSMGIFKMLVRINKENLKAKNGEKEDKKYQGVKKMITKFRGDDFVKKAPKNTQKVDSGIPTKTCQPPKVDIHKKYQYETAPNFNNYQPQALEYSQNVEVVLKTGKDGCGLRLSKFDEKSVDQVIIKAIKALSPADKCGKIKIGDELVKVNGVTIKELSYPEIIEMMRELRGTTISLVIAPNKNRSEWFDNDNSNTFEDRIKEILPRTTSLQRKESENIELNEAFVDDDTDFHLFNTSNSIPEFDESRKCEPTEERKLIEVTLKRGVNGFGFSLIGGISRNRELPFYIQSLTSGGPALLSKKIRPGDKIRAINGMQIQGMSHQDVVDNIKSIPNEMTLLIETS
ncbi:Membrane-associated guanylate kinase, WW and PDZ domain-containing protein 1 [Thelohanellus kitauei]|uniref:Membrane-associated guanylate kinase, WW and PDZ domain-containing protein 1 n=1 Tax=Thelohanellus kitauei TaxID=669202 RepID=A0A0C2IC65_THEKT|nr:Membrane-associated guanylate kinase, WW and PDZ domain-containing protein 1 [Thelohanellus kitauei]